MNSVQLTRLDSAQQDFALRLSQLIGNAEHTDPLLEQDVRSIIDRVRSHGDRALLELTAKYDGLELDDPSQLRVSRQLQQQAFDRLPDSERRVLEEAARRIGAYHRWQLQQFSGLAAAYRDNRGLVIRQQICPLARVGIYAPGGQAAYCSTILMTAIPARIAGVEELVLATPASDGLLRDRVLATAWLVEADEVYSIGGAQAIAALALGTNTIARTDKIVGPGNRYVNQAKQLLQGTVGIDMLAGPSEILIICDAHCDPDWIVQDLFAQAEHDEQARAILLCPDRSYLNSIESGIEKLIESQPRRATISQALCNHGALIEVADLREAIAISNRIAPEHLSLAVADPEQLLSEKLYAGAVFLGPRAAQVLGDYCAGPSHVLPTAGTARFRSGLNIGDFLRITPLIGGDLRDDNIYRTAAAFATMEGLPAHAAAAGCRLTNDDRK